MVDWGKITGKPNWVERVKVFGQKPKETLIGLIAAILLGGIYDIWMKILEGIRYLWEGSTQGFNPSGDNPLGIADLPRLVAHLLADAFAPIRMAIIALVELVNELLTGLAAQTGPFAPVIAVAIGAWIAAIVIRAGLSLAGDLPGVGAVMNFFGLS